MILSRNEFWIHIFIVLFLNSYFSNLQSFLAVSVLPLLPPSLPSDWSLAVLLLQPCLPQDWSLAPLPQPSLPSDWSQTSRVGTVLPWRRLQAALPSQSRTTPPSGTQLSPLPHFRSKSRKKVSARGPLVRTNLFMLH